MIELRDHGKTEQWGRGVANDEKIQLFKSDSADCCSIDRARVGDQCVYAVWIVTRGVQQYSDACHDCCGFDYVQPDDESKA